MSDVSGIPYMGPMGQGNFFAPQFSYNPQMSAGAASAGYAGPSAYAQNITNNTFASGGGFGRQTDLFGSGAAEPRKPVQVRRGARFAGLPWRLALWRLYDRGGEHAVLRHRSEFWFHVRRHGRYRSEPGR